MKIVEPPPATATGLLQQDLEVYNARLLFYTRLHDNLSAFPSPHLASTMYVIGHVIDWRPTVETVASGVCGGHCCGLVVGQEVSRLTL